MTDKGSPLPSTPYCYRDEEQWSHDRKSDTLRLIGLQAPLDLPLPSALISLVGRLDAAGENRRRAESIRGKITGPPWAK